MPTACPWCGEEANDTASYDAWLAAHVTECEPFIQELSSIYPEAQ